MTGYLRFNSAYGAFFSVESFIQPIKDMAIGDEAIGDEAIGHLQIHQIWIGPMQPLPEPIKQYYMKSVSYMAINNNAKYRLWGNKDITKINFPMFYYQLKYHHCLSTIYIFHLRFLWPYQLHHTFLRLSRK